MENIADQDISIFLDNIKLNIRVAVIIETKNGYIFEKDPPYDFYYVVGGRIKINETSEEAGKREVFEELGIKIENIKLKSIVESYFELDNIKYHEIGFYYKYKMDQKIELPEKYYELTIEEVKNENIQPKIIYDIIKSKTNDILHIILKE